MMNLKTLVEKTPVADRLREMIGLAAQRLIEIEVAGLTGASYGEKSAERLWCSPTAIASGFGDPRPSPVELRIPKLKGQLLPLLP